MAAFTRLCVIGWLVAMVSAYPQGPPVGLLPGLCSNMMPAHGYPEEKGRPPFEIVTSGTCYKPDIKLTVRLRILYPDDDHNYFEGFFLQARRPGETSRNFGTFDHLMTDGLQELACFSRDKSAISHDRPAHWLVRTFDWTAPKSHVGDLQFITTVVQHQETNWINLTSDLIIYDPDCAALPGLAPEEFGDEQNIACDSHEEKAGLCGCSATTAQILLICALLSAAYLL